MKYENLLEESSHENLIVKEKNLSGYKGRIYKNRVAIRRNMTYTEKGCVLAEELGHYYTGYGDILDQSSVSNRKQELRGRIYAYNKLVGLMGIIDAYKNHCQSIYEAAKYLEVTEEFLLEALAHYKSKYGKCVTLDNYTIYFEPCLCVLEMK
ncbi:MAG: hypothetical protein K2N94_07220 [Lachnospiraceae bacterium]|nr:hypothetical protein [Lachnospiraceae bacterium]